MAAVMPQITPWMIPPRGSSDGVKERHAKMSAPQQPGSVTYSSFLGLPAPVWRLRCLGLGSSGGPAGGPGMSRATVISIVLSG